MRNYILTLFAVSIFALISCNSDKSSSVEEMTEENVEEMAEDLLAQEMAALEEEASSDEEAVTNEVEVALDEVDVDEEAALEQKKEIKKEQLKASPNLGKDCESLLKEYEVMVDKYLKGEDKDGVLKQMAIWANDPIFNRCKKDDAFKDKFFELEEKMYADDDEEL